MSSRGQFTGAASVSKTVSAVELPMRHGCFWRRVFAAIVDFIVLALAIGILVSFYAVGKGTPLAFTGLHPG